MSLADWTSLVLGVVFLSFAVWLRVWTDRAVKRRERARLAEAYERARRRRC